MKIMTDKILRDPFIGWQRYYPSRIVESAEASTTSTTFTQLLIAEGYFNPTDVFEPEIKRRARFVGVLSLRTSDAAVPAEGFIRWTVGGATYDTPVRSTTSTTRVQFNENIVVDVTHVTESILRSSVMLRTTGAATAYARVNLNGLFVEVI